MTSEEWVFGVLSWVIALIGMAIAWRVWRDEHRLKQRLTRTFDELEQHLRATRTGQDGGLPKLRVVRGQLRIVRGSENQDDEAKP